MRCDCFEEVRIGSEKLHAGCHIFILHRSNTHEAFDLKSMVSPVNCQYRILEYGESKTFMVPVDIDVVAVMRAANDRHTSCWR